MDVSKNKIEYSITLLKEYAVRGEVKLNLFHVKGVLFVRKRVRIVRVEAGLIAKLQKHGA